MSLYKSINPTCEVLAGEDKSIVMIFKTAHFSPKRRCAKFEEVKT